MNFDQTLQEENKMEAGKIREPLYLDDLAVGDVFVSDTYALSAEDIIRFAG